MNENNRREGKAAATTDRRGIDVVPVLDNRTGAHNTLYCRPRRDQADGRSVRDAALLSEGWSDRPNAARLIANLVPTVNAAVAMARRLVAEGSDTRLIVPVHGMALSRKEVAGAFTDACRKAGEAERDKLIFEVVGMADEAGMSYLDDVAIVLYPFCLTYGARVSPVTPNLKIFATCNYTGVSLDMLDRDWPEDKVRAYFERFVRMTEASRLKAYVHGIATEAIRQATTDAGVRFVSGSVFGPAQTVWMERETA